jgi:hypothetical protein
VVCHLKKRYSYFSVTWKVTWGCTGVPHVRDPGPFYLVTLLCFLHQSYPVFWDDSFIFCHHVHILVTGKEKNVREACSLPLRTFLGSCLHYFYPHSIDQNGCHIPGRSKRFYQTHQALWLTPIIQATWEAEIRNITVPSQHRQKVHETFSQSVTACSGSGLPPQLYGGVVAEIGRIVTPASPGKKRSWDPISKGKCWEW